MESSRRRESSNEEKSYNQQQAFSNALRGLQDYIDIRTKNTWRGMGNMLFNAGLAVLHYAYNTVASKSEEEKNVLSTERASICLQILLSFNNAKTFVKCLETLELLNTLALKAKEDKTKKNHDGRFCQCLHLLRRILLDIMKKNSAMNKDLESKIETLLQEVAQKERELNEAVNEGKPKEEKDRLRREIADRRLLLCLLDHETTILNYSHTILEKYSIPDKQKGKINNEKPYVFQKYFPEDIYRSFFTSSQTRQARTESYETWLASPDTLSRICPEAPSLMSLFTDELTKRSKGEGNTAQILIMTGSQAAVVADSSGSIVTSSMSAMSSSSSASMSSAAITSSTLSSASSASMSSAAITSSTLSSASSASMGSAAITSSTLSSASSASMSSAAITSSTLSSASSASMSSAAAASSVISNTAPAILDSAIISSSSPSTTSSASNSTTPSAVVDEVKALNPEKKPNNAPASNSNTSAATDIESISSVWEEVPPPLKHRPVGKKGPAKAAGIKPSTALAPFVFVPGGATRLNLLESLTGTTLPSAPDNPVPVTPSTTVRA